MKLLCNGREFDISRPCVMGVLNVTPDSFSDGGLYCARDAALLQARAMVEQGAAIIDVGGESTRPGAQAVPLEEELDRVIPVIEAIADSLPIPISIDTTKPEVMRAAVAAGAGLINDVSALQAPGAMAAVTELQVPVCLMHMQGSPRTMQTNPSYQDVAQEVTKYLVDAADKAVQAGVKREQIILDPGFGFGKSLQHNFQLMAALEHLTTLIYPVLVGVSRKSMIGQLMNNQSSERLPGSLALATIAVLKGARIIRAHDVAETVQAIRMAEEVLRH